MSHIYEFLQNNRSLRNTDAETILPTKGRNSRLLDSPWAMKLSVETVPGCRVRRFGNTSWSELIPRLEMAQRLGKTSQMVFQLESLIRNTS